MLAQILIGTLLATGDPAPAHAVVSMSHDKGDEYALDNCAGRTRFAAEVEGASRLSPSVGLDGSVRYRYTSEVDHTGTAFIVTDDLRPFDIVLDNPGDNNTHAFDLTAGAQWRANDHVAVGAKALYTVADRARIKDLRYAEDYMDLNASAGVSLRYGIIEMGASAIYRRTVESIAFSVAGTNDIVYTPLIDYGNGLGISESYNGTGFADDTRQPLLSLYGGVSLQARIRPASALRIFLSGGYAHRTGHYGRESQYTIVHDRFHGNCWDFVLAAQCATSTIRARWRIDNLVNFRTNYLSQLINGVTYYEYYQPTKTAVKMRFSGEVAYTGSFTPLGKGLYRWRLNAGTAFCRQRVTAWVYPASRASDCTLIRPYASLQATLPIKGGARLTAEGGTSYRTSGGNFVPDYNMYTRTGFDIFARVQYAHPKIKSLGLSPAIFAGGHTLHRYLECGITVDI